MKKLLLTLALAAMSAVSYGQGTIAFGNSALTTVKMNGVAVPTSLAIKYGVFFGTSADAVSTTAVTPLGASSTATAGIIVAGSVYALPGTDGGQVVFLQVRGWDAQYATYQEARAAGKVWGETDIRSVTLAPTAGPGTVIWQTATGTNPNRFRPLELIPEPSTIALGVLGLGSLLLFRRRQSK